MLAPYRIMVRPLVTGVSKIAEMVEQPPLDHDEKEGGVMAFSALMYQYGGELDARVLVALWLAGVTIPRVLNHLNKEKKERDAKKHNAARREADFGKGQQGGNADALTRAKTVEGQRVDAPPPVAS